jgi:hypothetical protein
MAVESNETFVGSLYGQRKGLEALADTCGASGLAIVTRTIETARSA